MWYVVTFLVLIVLVLKRLDRSLTRSNVVAAAFLIYGLLAYGLFFEYLNRAVVGTLFYHGSGP